MKTIFLTSDPKTCVKQNGKRIATPMDNTNGFIDNLFRYNPRNIKISVIASNPDEYIKSEIYKDIAKESFILSGFNVESISLINHKFMGNIEDTILSSNIVILSGGHTPTQNKFIHEIELQKILEKFNGTIIGISAGAMNCTKDVYVQPDNEEEYNDVNFKKILKGLDYTSIKLYPHINKSKADVLCGESKYDMCMRDSTNYHIYGITDGGYILIESENATLYGETFLFKDGHCSVVCKTGESININSCEHSH